MTKYTLKYWEEKIHVTNCAIGEARLMAVKNRPKRDSSGGGTRNNKGRSGCKTTRKTGQGSNRRKR